jgi:hypothetical protein
MAVAELDALAPPLEMSIPRIASLTIFALTSTVQVEELGTNQFHFRSTISDH